MNKCNRPPEGWECSREPGHDGPCAATKTQTALQAAEERAQSLERRLETCKGERDDSAECIRRMTEERNQAVERAQKAEADLRREVGLGTEWKRLHDNALSRAETKEAELADLQARLGNAEAEIEWLRPSRAQHWKNCKKAESERDLSRANEARLRAVLEAVYYSASPNPDQHPSMFAAWQKAKAALAATPAEPAGETGKRIPIGTVKFDQDGFVQDPPISPATTAAGEPLPCPFCAIVPAFIDETGVQCQTGGCPMDGSAISVTAWNNRPTQPEGDAKDGARLDWLEKHCPSKVSGDKISFTLERYAENLRTAIDAAMAQTGEARG